MTSIRRLVSLSFLVTTTIASLKSIAVDPTGLLLARHASGCSHSTTWQDNSANSTAPVCNNGTSLSIVNTTSLFNKTDCQALVEQLSTKAGKGYWDVQWACDSGSPNNLGSSGACDFTIENVTTSNENK